MNEIGVLEWHLHDISRNNAFRNGNYTATDSYSFLFWAILRFFAGKRQVFYSALS